MRNMYIASFLEDGVIRDRRLIVMVSEEEMASLEALTADVAAGTVVLPCIVSRRRKPTWASIVRHLLTVGIPAIRSGTLNTLLVKE